MASIASNPFVFLVGCPRSGTTLLERMVNAHPRIAIIHETHWITRYYRKRTGLTRKGLVTPDFISTLSQYHRFHLLKTTREALEELLDSMAPVSYADFVAAIFDRYGKGEGKPLVGDKTTGGYVRHLPILHALWPDARIVHLIRDGRDVCLSMLDWPKAHRAAARLTTWDENPVATTALWWKWHLELGCSAGVSIGPECYTEIRYESLVRDPADQCASLCSFLGVEPDDAMLNFHAGRTKTDAGLSANQAWLPPTTGLRDWRTQMAEHDIELFEAIAGDLLSALGYERAFDTISPAVAAIADRFLSQWAADHDMDSPSASRDRARSRSGHRVTASESPQTPDNSPPSEKVQQNPYLFVVGCPRSGTTLLQRMLDSHPQLAVANDTHFIPRVLDRTNGGPNPPLTPELVNKVRAYRRFPRLGLDHDAVTRAGKHAQTYAQFVSGLYCEFGRMHGKPLAGEKTPDYARNLPLLHSLFPWAKFVHLIRDGRDVALSTLEWAHEGKGPGRIGLWQEEPVAVCALWWRRNVEYGRDDGADLGATRYHEVVYERLVDHPGQALQDVAAFLDVPFAEEMLAFHEGKTRSNPGLSAKSAWLPPTTGLRNWREQMDPRDVELFEALAGDLLSSLGYERAFERISPAIADIAERCREWWSSRKWRRNTGSRV